MSDTESSERSQLPSWFHEVLRLSSKNLYLVLVGAALTVFAVLWLAGQLASFLTTLGMAVFLSFALEPAVDWFEERGWRRGLATGLIMALLVLLGILLLALIIPAVVAGFSQLVDSAPELVDRLASWLRPFGVDLSTQNLIAELRANADRVIAAARDIAGVFLLGLAGSILGTLFRLATVGLFTFYFVAEGPKVRRTILSRMRPDRQARVLFVWEKAIDQTGGYFYSRLLLAVINGTGMYITLRLTNVPFAAPLAIFEGLLAEFIPIVGTYIGGAIPVLVAFLTSTEAGLWALAYVIVYQQIENYLLSPRLTAKTMSLHPAVAFAAAMIGAALGGVLFAFLALPVAGVIQAAVKEWGRSYEVVGAEAGSGEES